MCRDAATVYQHLEVQPARIVHMAGVVVVMVVVCAVGVPCVWLNLLPYVPTTV